MDKSLLSDRPPAYSTVPGTYEYGQQSQQHNYGAISPPAPGFHPPPPPPPPYQYPGPGYPPAPPQTTGYPPGPPQVGVATAQQPCYAGTYTIIQPSVVVVGGCPACRVGVLEDDFTCLGILCAIVFFPLGILFCLALRQRRCPNCGASFG